MNWQPFDEKEQRYQIGRWPGSFRQEGTFKRDSTTAAQQAETATKKIFYILLFLLVKQLTALFRNTPTIFP